MAQRQFRSDDTSLWQYGFGNGSAGDLTVSSDITASSISGYANTTISVSNGTTSATAGSGTDFTNGDLVLIHQSRNGGTGAGVWELNRISSKGSGTDWTLENTACNDYGTTAQVYKLIQHSSITIDSTKTLTGVTWGGTTGGIIALMSSNGITVSGNISTASKGYGGGAGTTDTTGQVQEQGEGTAGAAILSQSANGNGGGGGKNEYGSQSWTGGAGGGNGAAGSDATGRNGSPTSTGGTSVGSVGLTTMVFGGGGGEYNSASGGNGGGIILLIAKTITITGTIVTGGGAGAGVGGGSSGSGGGAGGSVLMKAHTATLGTNLITSSGGAGGTSSYGTPGGAGAVGRIHLDYKTSYTGTTTPTIDTTQDITLDYRNTGASFIYQLLN